MQHFESEIFLLQHGVDLHGDGVVNIRNHWSLLQHGRHLMYMELWIPAAACTDNHWFLLQHGLHLHGVVNTRRCQHGQPLVLVTAWTALTWSCEYPPMPARTTIGSCYSMDSTYMELWIPAAASTDNHWSLLSFPSDRSGPRAWTKMSWDSNPAKIWENNKDIKGKIVKYSYVHLSAICLKIRAQNQF